ncbi:MAG: PCRF domain-containing protein [Candidatus Vogelbacteria bacterium]|nr:PCRF domain-containing protein [Candidatus Vogelbacteria bacterium]
MKDLKNKIVKLEAQMMEADFWADKIRAQEIIKELSELKDKLAGQGKYDVGNAILTLLAGAGGDDAEDFVAMLYEMYSRFATRRGFSLKIIHKNVNDQGGYRNITALVEGKGVYGILKKESGVHRLVRLSPFNSKSLRHTSFALVEVIPELPKVSEVEILEADLRLEFARSSGPGGQNVNKRETSVRVVHIPTGLAVHCESERSQAQNKERALQILSGKLYKKLLEAKEKESNTMKLSQTTDIEWGNQIRSYVLHPYKLIKDHRTGVEERDVDKVLEEGNLDEFVEAEQNI